MSNLAIKVVDLGKQYRIGRVSDQAYRTLRDNIADMAASPFRKAYQLLRGDRYAALVERSETLWALRDINLEVEKGEVLGVIGHNGAGKSTLLKILSRITEPSTGYVDLYGRVGSLLEVGTGFHQELTGRENIYLNGSILGMPRAEIARKFDEIVSFSGVEKFIDTPVKHYSSGMHLRLGFSVAAHLEPDILLVDEVLAVGDAEFQKKCLGKMSSVASEGRTVLFVSHNINAVKNLCSMALWVDHGRIRKQGAVESVTNAYIRHNQQQSELSQGIVTIKIEILDSQEQALEAWRLDEEMIIRVRLDLAKPIGQPTVDVSCYSVEIGARLFSLQSDMFVTEDHFHDKQHLIFDFHVTNSSIVTSEVYLDVGVRGKGEQTFIALFQYAEHISVLSSAREQYTRAHALLHLPTSLKIRALD